jgi:hypothetical protein
MRKLHLINCWKQKHLTYTLCSVCSLHKHFIGFIVSFQIGSNLVGSSLISKGKSVHIKKSMSSSRAIKEPVEIYTILRSCMKCEHSTIWSSFLSKQELHVSSEQSKGCLSMLHTNNNRAGLPPVGPMNLYTWAFGLTSCRISMCLKRICEPTLNRIRGLFVCTWYYTRWIFMKNSFAYHPILKDGNLRCVDIITGQAKPSQSLDIPFVIIS